MERGDSGPLEDSTKVFIYGTGEVGRKCYEQLLRNSGVDAVVAFIDSHEGGVFCDKRVIPVEELLEWNGLYRGEKIIIATNNNEEIVEALEAQGLCKYELYDQAKLQETAQAEARFPSLSFQSFQRRMIFDHGERYQKPGRFDLASIIVLVHNNLRLTQISLRSLIASTFHPFELILLDNGSDAETAQWLESFVVDNPDTNIRLLRRDPPDTWDRQKRIYNAKNAALEMVRGDLIVVNDNDLGYQPFWLSYAACILDTFPEVGVLGLQRFKGPEHEILSRKNRSGIGLYLMNTVEGCNLIFSHELFRKIGSFRESPQEYEAPFEAYVGCDVEFTYRFRDLGLWCAVPDRDVITHVQQPH